MKKKFKMKNLGCAHCAEKMVDAIQKIEGVQDVSINFVLQKMTLTADDNRFEQIVEEAKKAISQIEPDCTLV